MNVHPTLARRVAHAAWMACLPLPLVACIGGSTLDEDLAMIEFKPLVSEIEVLAAADVVEVEDGEAHVQLGEPVLRSGVGGTATAPAPRTEVKRPKAGAPPFVSIPVEGTGPGVVTAARRKPVAERIAESQRTGKTVRLREHELFELIDRNPTAEERANPRLLLRR